VDYPHKGQAIYHLHVKEGTFPNHHHYNVEFEVNNGKIVYNTIEEGRKSIF